MVLDVSQPLCAAEGGGGGETFKPVGKSLYSCGLIFVDRSVLYGEGLSFIVMPSKCINCTMLINYILHNITRMGRGKLPPCPRQIRQCIIKYRLGLTGILLNCRNFIQKGKLHI